MRKFPKRKNIWTRKIESSKLCGILSLIPPKCVSQPERMQSLFSAESINDQDRPRRTILLPGSRPLVEVQEVDFN
jgi:hypothetical protein